jgi:hypothetical protein
MRKEQEEQAKVDAAYFESQSDSIKMTTAITRGLFGVAAAALLFVALSGIQSGSISFSGTSSSTPAGGSNPAFSAPSFLPKPNFRTGYEDKTDIGKVRPMFNPEEAPRVPTQLGE